MAVVLIGFIGLIIAGSLYWDRGSEAGGSFVSGWLTDRFGTDISQRVEAVEVEEINGTLPGEREFHDRDSYLDFLDGYHREFVSSMERFANLVSNPQLRNEGWQDAVAHEIAVIRHLDDEARTVTPPDEFQSAHDHWVNGMSEYRRAVDTSASALDNMSLSELGDAIGALSSATQSYIGMADTLDELGALRDLETMEELRNIEYRR